MKPNAVKKYNPDPVYLRNIAEETGLTRQELADRIGVSRRTLQSWLSGEYEYSYPDQFTIEALARR